MLHKLELVFEDSTTDFNYGVKIIWKLFYFCTCEVFSPLYELFTLEIR